MREAEQAELLAARGVEPAAIAERQRREQRAALAARRAGAATPPRGTRAARASGRQPSRSAQPHDQIGMQRRAGRADAAPGEIAGAIAHARVRRDPPAPAAARAARTRSPGRTLAERRRRPLRVARSRSRIRSGTRRRLAGRGDRVGDTRPRRRRALRAAATTVASKLASTGAAGRARAAASSRVASASAPAQPIAAIASSATSRATAARCDRERRRSRVRRAAPRATRSSRHPQRGCRAPARRPARRGTRWREPRAGPGCREATGGRARAKAGGRQCTVRGRSGALVLVRMRWT